MNICLYDSWNGKFSKDIEEHWKSLGHKVLINPPWEAMLEADLTFCYQCDNQAQEASKKPRKGKLVIQCVDIEIWSGQHLGVDWTKVDGALFMAQHIQDMVFKVTHPISESINTIKKSALIKPGIDLNKFTPKADIFYTNPVPNQLSPIRRIAYVVGNGRIWDVKRFDIALQLLKDLMNSEDNHIWQLHVRGTYSTHEQYNAYCKYLEKDLGLEGHLFWYPDKVEDMNVWLEDKDYLLLPSTKEAFSYATAEAMAKGIKPIINNWQGSKETWGKYVCNTYGEMLAEILRGEYNPEEYREYIKNHYSQDRYFNDLDNFMLGGGN